MSLKVRDFFTTSWMYPIPGVSICFKEPEDQVGEGELIPTHKVHVSVKTAGMAVDLVGNVYVDWSEEQFAQRDDTAFKAVVKQVITSKLVPYVQLTADPVVVKI